MVVVALIQKIARAVDVNYANNALVQFPLDNPLLLAIPLNALNAKEYVLRTIRFFNDLSRISKAALQIVRGNCDK